MNSRLTSIRLVLSAAAVAIALAAGAISPAQAQSLGSEFSFGGGGAQPDAQAFGTEPNAQGSQQERHEFRLECLTNRQIRRALRDFGFSDVDFVRELRRNRVIVEALYEDDWYYSMRVHRCERYADRVRPLYPLDEDDGFYF